MTEPWYVYLVRVTNDGKLYCGITNNIEARMAKHASGKGAKYLRGKNFQLAWFMTAPDKSTAAKLEYAIKQLPKKEKEQIVGNAPMYVQDNNWNN